MRRPLIFDEPALVTARDGSLFSCYLEDVAGRGDRWVYVSANRTRYDGGIYAGEETLEQLAARVSAWWAESRFRT